jgi:hypothetical protein
LAEAPLRLAEAPLRRSLAHRRSEHMPLSSAQEAGPAQYAMGQAGGGSCVDDRLLMAEALEEAQAALDEGARVTRASSSVT